MTIALADRGASARCVFIRRTFANAFAALKEHAKTRPDEAADLYDTIAAHVRSASPQSFLGDLPPTLDVGGPATAIERELGAGAKYELRVIDGARLLHVLDEHGHDALVSLSDGQRMTLIDDLRSVR